MSLESVLYFRAVRSRGNQQPNPDWRPSKFFQDWTASLSLTLSRWMSIDAALCKVARNLAPSLLLIFMSCPDSYIRLARPPTIPHHP